MILVTYLLKESEIVIEQLSYDFRGVPRRRKVEVRRIPYHTQDRLTNFATNPADYPLIRTLNIDFLDLDKMTHLIMSILNQLKTTFYWPSLHFCCAIGEKPVDSIYPMNAAKTLELLKFLFEICYHSSQFILFIVFEKDQQSSSIQEFVNSLLDLIRVVDCTSMIIWLETEQNFVLPIEKIVQWLYRPQKKIEAEAQLEIDLSLDIEVGEMKNTKDIVERLKKVIC